MTKGLKKGLFFLVIFITTFVLSNIAMKYFKLSQPQTIAGDYQATLDAYQTKYLLFTLEGCKACQKSKEYFQNNKIAVEIVEIKDVPEAIKKQLKINKFPFLVTNKLILKGYNEEAYDKYIEF